MADPNHCVRNMRLIDLKKPPLLPPSHALRAQFHSEQEASFTKPDRNESHLMLGEIDFQVTFTITGYVLFTDYCVRWESCIQDKTVEFYSL